MHVDQEDRLHYGHAAPPPTSNLCHNDKGDASSDVARGSTFAKQHSDVARRGTATTRVCGQGRCGHIQDVRHGTAATRVCRNRVQPKDGDMIKSHTTNIPKKNAEGLTSKRKTETIKSDSEDVSPLTKAGSQDSE